MTDTESTVRIFIALLLIASAVAMATKWVQVPYTLALVIVGLAISPMHFLPPVHISPDLILLIFLPALLFEAAWNLKLATLRRNLLPILVLVLPGVCLSVTVIALILHYGVGMGWHPALLFGTMISATDPVSVLALFKRMGLPKPLTTIVEGESLFNDGTAVVLFHIMLGVAASSSPPEGGLLLHAVREFLVEVAGGLAVGLTVGLIAAQLTSFFDDHLLEIMLTTIAAYGSYLAADAIQVSPVIAVLLAGLVIGNYGRDKGMSPNTQMAVNSFWDYAAFVVNSLVFLLIGLEIQVPALAENTTYILWAVFAVMAARAVDIYSLMPLASRKDRPVSLRWRHVLFWGGLRGSLSIAMALSIPLSMEGRSQLVVMVFGTVTFSLLAQGLTISPLLRWLGFSDKAPHAKEYELLRGQLAGEKAALDELERLRERGMIPAHLFASFHEDLSKAQQERHRRLEEIGPEQGELEQKQEEWIRKRVANAQRARLSEMQRVGLLSSEAHEQLNEQLGRAFPESNDE